MVGDVLLWELRRQKDVVIPEGVQEIGERWFWYSEVESMIIPRSVKKIGSEAFYNCDNLKKVCVEDCCEASFVDAMLSHSVLVFPPPKTMMGSVRVWDLRNCKQVVIPDGIERIGNQWFWGSEIASVTIPTNVREIGPDTFRNSKNLREVVFQEKSRLKSIRDGVFYYCGNLAKINLPEGLTSIEDGVFCSCVNLKSIKLPDKLEKVGAHCFSGSGL